MTDTTKGFAAMIAACCIWGLSSIFYKSLSHVPAAEVLAHRTLWSLVFFVIVLAGQRLLRAILDAMAGPRAFGLLAFAALVIATNWYLFIWAVQSGQATEAALGYYIFPLVSVLLGRLVFAERLSPVQLFAVGLVTVAVSLLTFAWGPRLGSPWRWRRLLGFMGSRKSGWRWGRSSLSPLRCCCCRPLRCSCCGKRVTMERGPSGPPFAIRRC